MIKTYSVKTLGTEYIPGCRGLAGESGSHELHDGPEDNETTKRIPKQTMSSLTGDQVQEEDDGQLREAQGSDEQKVRCECALYLNQSLDACMNVVVR